MNTQAETRGKSPWARKNKRPYIYSDELNNWTACVRKGDKAGADKWDRAWRKKFGVGSRPEVREANPLDFGDIHGDFDDAAQNHS